MSKNIAFALTLTMALGSIAWAVVAGLEKDQWLMMLQSLGTVVALVWVIYAGLLQERTGNRDILLQSLDLIKADLEDLTKAIETEIGKLGSKEEEYEHRFHQGERTAYIAPITADNGRRLRALFTHDQVRTPQLERRLRTYVSMFAPIMSMSEADPDFRGVIETSPHGRAHLAMKAALAKTDGEAALFMKRLSAHDTVGT